MPGDAYIAILALVAVSAPVVLINVLLSAKDIVIQRVLTPPRVEEERAKTTSRSVKRAKADEEEAFDPLA